MARELLGMSFSADVDIPVREADEENAFDSQSFPTLHHFPRTWPGHLFAMMTANLRRFLNKHVLLSFNAVGGGKSGLTKGRKGGNESARRRELGGARHIRLATAEQVAANSGCGGSAARHRCLLVGGSVARRAD